MIFHLISLSQKSNPLCVSVSSSEAGERLKDVSRRAAEIAERADCVVGFAQERGTIRF